MKPPTTTTTTNKQNGSTTTPAPKSYPPYHGGYYVTPTGAQALRSFQYRGADLSPIYQYILSPLAAFLVQHVTPRTAAPNAITLLGLSLMMASYVLIWWHCPAFDDAFKHEMNADADADMRWIFLFNAITMLLYQTLDNMDGKQARLTSSSSPLGLLFDHGCDALNLVLGSTNWCCAMGLSPQSSQLDAFLCYSTVMCAMVPFFVCTWEEYYTGELILPPFNGPTEGLILGAGLSLLSFLNGVGYWHQTTWYDMGLGPVLGYAPPVVKQSLLHFFTSNDGNAVGTGTVTALRNCDVLLLISYLALFREILPKIYSIVTTYGRHTLRNLLPVLYLVFATSFLMGMTSLSYPDNTNTTSTNTNNSKTLMQTHPRLCMNLCSVLFVDMVTDLMFRHMTLMEYDWLRWKTLIVPTVVMYLVRVSPRSFFSASAGELQDSGMDNGNTSGNGSRHWVEEDVVCYAWCFFTGMVVFVAVKIHIVVREMCDCLGIWCFDIVKPYVREQGVLYQPKTILEKEKEKVG